MLVDVAWDGVIGDKIVVAISDDAKFVKVADVSYTVDEYAYMSVIIKMSDGSSAIFDYSSLETGDSYVKSQVFVISVAPNITVGGINFPEAGIYVVQNKVEGELVYVSKLTGGMIAQIPDVFVDLTNLSSRVSDAQYDAERAHENANSAQTAAQNAQTVAQNAQTAAQNAVSKIGSSRIKYLESSTGSSISLEPGSQFTGTIKVGDVSSKGSKLKTIITQNSISTGNANASTSSTIRLDASASVGVIKITNGNGNGLNLNGNGEILVVGSEDISFSYSKGIIIKSSTSGSTKKFKITVDDAGTLTATEVT